jgi:hypothetical protein
MLYIFDLDHTVIDSSHRQITRADGSLDLNAWRLNCTKKQINRDSLLPLARFMRRAIADPNTQTAICTARVLSKHDYNFLAEKGLVTDYILARFEGDNRADDEMKYTKIWNLLTSLKIPRARWKISATLFDDNQQVLKMATNRLGINAVDSIEYNRGLLKNA